jgi:type II secretory pathway component PulM
LIPSITNAANQNQLKLDRLQPDSDGGVNITLQEQQFDHVLKWLTLLETKQGLSVERLSIDRGDKASKVSGQVKLVN